jgi:integrase
MSRTGLGRTTINARINRIRRVFRWAASVELIPPSIVQALQTVAGLQRGRTEAKEPEAVEPVPIERVEAVLPHLPRPVAAMVRLQLLTGCRPGEVMRIRGRDLTPGEPTWVYRPDSHKNRWRGQERLIPLGPKAQAIIWEFLKQDLAAYLFSPWDAVAAHHEERAGRRKSKRTPLELRRLNRQRAGQGRALRYDRRTYRQAIVRACDRVFPHPTLSLIAPRPPSCWRSRGAIGRSRTAYSGWVT